MSFNSPTSMLFPSYVNGKVLDDKDNFSPDWNIYFSQLTQQLQVNFSNEGITIPSQSTASINDLVITNLTTKNLNNKLFINSDTGDINVILNFILTRLAPLVEDDFVPTLTDSSGNQPTYVTQNANLSKVGDRTFINLQMEISDKSTLTGADLIRISSLPYVVGEFTQLGSFLPGNNSFSFPPNASIIVPQAIVGEEYITLAWLNNDGTITDVTWNDFSATGSFTLNINYKV